MKKLIPLQMISWFAGALLLASTVFGASPIEGFNPLNPDGKQASPEIRLVSETDNRLVVEWDLSGFTLSKVTSTEGAFQRISLGDWKQSSGSPPGTPELPMLTQMIRLPRGYTAQVKLISADWLEFDGVRIAPRQPPMRDGDEEPTSLVFDPAAYSSSEIIPADFAGIGRASGWMGETVASIWAVPVRYSPADGRLEVASHLTLHVTFVPGAGLDIVVPRHRSEIADQLFRAALLNPPRPEPRRDEPNEPEPVRMLVVLRHEALETARPLIDLHERIGQKTLIWEIDEDVTAEQIKERISDLFEEGLQYVLIIGDGNVNNSTVPMVLWDPADPDPQLPADVREPSESGSDSWYVCLDPVDRDGFEDHIPDLAIGRLVYDGPNDLDQLEIQVAKLVDYITWSFEDQDDSWLRRAIFPTDKEIAGAFIRCVDTILNYDYNLDHPEMEPIYGNVVGNSNGVIVERMNAGQGIVNYRGHGDETKWYRWNRNSESFSLAHVAQLENRQKPFIVVSSACETADMYDFGGTCLLEAFQKRSGGSLSAHGAIITSFNGANSFFDIAIYKAFFDEGIYSIGYAGNLAHAQMVSNYDAGGNYPGEGRTNARTYVWLGDPALQYRLATPVQLAVAAPDSIPIGAQRVEVTVTSGEGAGFSGAVLTLRGDDPSVYAITTSDANGIGVFDLDAPLEGPARLYCTAWNREAKPATDTILVMNGRGVIEGTVTELADSTAVNGATVTLSRFDTITNTDVNGFYRLEGIASGAYTLTVRFPGLIAQSREVDVVEDDTITLDFQLAFSNFEMNHDEISTNIESGGLDSVNVTISNTGNGTLEWRSSISYPSDHAPFDSLSEQWPSLETGDKRLNGAVFANGYFYVAGGNNNADDNYIYVFDRDGLEIVARRMVQPEGSSGYGIRDLAYDGEYLYGACDTTIWVMTLEGEVVSTIRGPYWPSTALAVDDQGTLWVGNNQALIAHIDRQGNVLGTLPNTDNIRGLAWMDNRDGYDLLIYTRNDSGGVIVHSINPETAEVTPYVNLAANLNEIALDGLEASLEYDPTQWTLIGMIAEQVDQEDPRSILVHLRLWSLAPRMGWITVTPEMGSVPPEQEQTVLIGFDAADVPAQTTLNAVLEFESNGRDDLISLPVMLAVIPNSVVNDRESTTPIAFGIKAIHPNPFNGSTTVEVSLPAAGRLSLAVYDLNGRLVESSQYDRLPVGRHSFTLTLNNLPSGVYLLRTESFSGVAAKKIVLLR